MIFLYNLLISEDADTTMKKMFRKNAKMQEIIRKKVKQIAEDPYRFKPLHAPLQNKRRVHIAGCFVLIYDIVESEKIVRIIKFAHHDQAYAS